MPDFVIGKVSVGHTSLEVSGNPEKANSEPQISQIDADERQKASCRKKAQRAQKMNQKLDQSASLFFATSAPLCGQIMPF